MAPENLFTQKQSLHDTSLLYKGSSLKINTGICKSAKIGAQPHGALGSRCVLTQREPSEAAFRPKQALVDLQPAAHE